jgi:hypothetical protein
MVQKVSMRVKLDLEAVLRKLRHKREYKSVVLNAPDSLAPEFEGAGFPGRMESDDYEFTLLFVRNKEETLNNFRPTVERIKNDSVFWLAYPKGTSKIETDVNRDKLWRMLEPYGYRPVSMVAIDSDWSAMRLRPTEKVKTR